MTGPAGEDGYFTAATHRTGACWPIEAGEGLGIQAPRESGEIVIAAGARWYSDDTCETEIVERELRLFGNDPRSDGSWFVYVANDSSSDRYVRAVSWAAATSSAP